MKENFGRIHALFAYYKLKEATTILKLALWKVKVDEVDYLNAKNRKECRVMCRADDVIPTVLSFLSKCIFYR